MSGAEEYSMEYSLSGAREWLHGLTPESAGWLREPLIEGVSLAAVDAIVLSLAVAVIAGCTAAAARRFLPFSKAKPAESSSLGTHQVLLEDYQHGESLGITLRPEGMVVTGVKPGSIAERHRLSEMVGMRLTHANNAIVWCLADVDKILEDLAAQHSAAGDEAPPQGFRVPLRFTELDEAEKLRHFTQENATLVRGLAEREEELSQIQKKHATSKETERVQKQKVSDLQDDIAKKDTMIARLESELQGACEVIEKKEMDMMHLESELQARGDADTALARALGEASRPPPSQELETLRQRVAQKEATINDLTKELAALDAKLAERVRQMGELQGEDERIQQQMADLRIDYDALSRATDEGAAQHAKEKQALREEVASLKHFVTATDEEIATLRRQVAEAQGSLAAQTGHASESQAHLKEEIDALRKQNGQLSIAMHESRDDATALRTRLNIVEAESDELRTQLESVREAKTTAATSASEEGARADELQQRLQDREAELEGANTRLQQMSRREERASAEASELAEARHSLAEAGRHAAVLEADVSRLKGEVAEGESCLRTAEEQLRDAERRADAAEQEGGAAQQEELRDACCKAENLSRTLHDRDAEIVLLKDASAQLRETVERRDMLLEDARSQEAHRSEEIRALRAELLELQEGGRRADELQGDVTRLREEIARLESKLATAEEGSAALQERLGLINDESRAVASENQRLTTRMEEMESDMATTQPLQARSSSAERVQELLTLEERRSAELAEQVAAGARKNDALEGSNSALEEMLTASKSRIEMLEKSCDSREGRIVALEDDLRTLRAALSPSRLQRTTSPRSRSSKITTPPQPADGSGAYHSPEHDHYGSLEVVSERGGSEGPSTQAVHRQGSTSSPSQGAALQRHMSAVSAVSASSGGVSDPKPGTPTQVEVLRMKNGLGYSAPYPSPGRLPQQQPQAPPQLQTQPQPQQQQEPPQRRGSTSPHRVGSVTAASVYARRAATASAASAAGIESHLPAALSVTSEEKPVVRGLYELVDGVIHNGYPMWGCGSCRIFSSREGYWMVSADDAGPMKNVGRLVSSTTHEGCQPDEIMAWDYSNGAEWVTSRKTKITRTVRAGRSHHSMLPARRGHSEPRQARRDTSPGAGADKGHNGARAASTYIPRLPLPSKDEGRGTEYGLAQRWEVLDNVPAAAAPSGVAYDPVAEVQDPAHSPAASLQICPAFLSGQCRKGASCPLLHDSMQAASSYSLVSPPFH